MKFNKDKLGTKSSKYWSNMSDYKPIGWKVIDGKKRIYSNFVDIVFTDINNHEYIDSIEIDYHVDYQRDLILDNTTSKEYIKFLCFDNYKLGHFYRDRLAFPFLESIILYSEKRKNEYLNWKKQYLRKQKINKLINERFFRS